VFDAPKALEEQLALCFMQKLLISIDMLGRYCSRLTDKVWEAKVNSVDISNRIMQLSIPLYMSCRSWTERLMATLSSRHCSVWFLLHWIRRRQRLPNKSTQRRRTQRKNTAWRATFTLSKTTTPFGPESVQTVWKTYPTQRRTFSTHPPVT
jgi:hypothetical protein